MGNHEGSILCVEDQPDLCELLVLVLSSLGYEVVTAQTYAGALGHCFSQPFDLYIINSGLPDGQGVDLCAEIRARGLQTPIILTSGGNDTKEILKAQMVGVNLILSKPFSLVKLEAEVKRLLS